MLNAFTYFYFQSQLKSSTKFYTGEPEIKFNRTSQSDDNNNNNKELPPPMIPGLKLSQ